MFKQAGPSRWNILKSSLQGTLSHLKSGRNSKQQMQKPIFSVENQSGPYTVNPALLPSLHREPMVKKPARLGSEKGLGIVKSVSSRPESSHDRLETKKEKLTRATTMIEGKEAMLSQARLQSHGYTAPAQKKKSWWQPSAEEKEKADRFNRNTLGPHAVRGRSAEAEAKSQGYYY